MTKEMSPPHDPADMHWLVFRDGAGWGCDGCDWTGKLDEFWATHGHEDENPSHDAVTEQSALEA